VSHVEPVELVEVMPDDDPSRLVLKVRGRKGIYRLSFVAFDILHLSQDHCPVCRVDLSHRGVV
jgi:hypothetical protein